MKAVIFYNLEKLNIYYTYLFVDLGAVKSAYSSTK